MKLVRLRGEDGDAVYINPEHVVQLWVCEVDMRVKVGLPCGMFATLATDDIEGVVAMLEGDTSASQAPPRDEDVVSVDRAELASLPPLPFHAFEGPPTRADPMRWDHVLVTFELLDMGQRSDVLAAFSRANERANRPHCPDCGQLEGRRHLVHCTNQGEL